MEEPWNIKKDDVRTEDSLPTFVIFCEDEVCESIYLKFFETASIKVNIVENQKSKTDNVYRAITHCVDKNWIGHDDGLSLNGIDGLQVWCVFDRDTEDDNSDGKRTLGDTDFNQSIKTALGKGIRVAWSNDAFELWILLHFEDVDHNTPDNKSRATYYERLTNIFRDLPDPPEKLTRAVAHESFGYKKDLKQRKNFRDIVRDTIIRNVKDAIRRAKLLEDHWNTTRSPDHAKCPCTLVHHLIEELIRVGGKVV